jgi:hypothetical protein
MTISTKEAERIAAQWHSPSPVDRNITALSHGLHHRIDKKGLLAEIQRDINSTDDVDDVRDLRKLKKWAEENL